ncbi:MAG: leucine-rich repeat protein [Acholeplasmataceae bacterium]|nr:leucine-rich repeat protein [Acholeplasmataceae bacterium]
MALIGVLAFENYLSLESIELSNSIVLIGLYAFESCSSVTEIVVGIGIIEINDFAFRYLENLVSITFHVEFLFEQSRRTIFIDRRKTKNRHPLDCRYFFI